MIMDIVFIISCACMLFATGIAIGLSINATIKRFK